MEQATLPWLSACIELYYAAYDQHGTDPFDAAELDWTASGTDTQHVLDLAVAYGLLTSNASVYQLSCDPDATAACWVSSVDERSKHIERAIASYTSQTSSNNGNSGRSALTYDGEEYASINVETSDDFASVVDSVRTVDLDGYEGVVLRSPGDYANEVQRFTDRLCQRSDEVELPISTSFDKEYSDVRGTEKNALEFRVFLRAL